MHRVCGEYISVEAESFLNKLGVDTTASSRIHQLLVSAPSGRTLRSPLDSGGFGMSRYELDRQLYELALKSGVSVQTNCSVESIENVSTNQIVKTADGRFFRAALAISAHGKRSSLDRYWNRTFFKKRSPYVGVKYHIRSDFDTSTIALHNFLDGYCGFSAIENNAYCLCYLSSRENLRKHGSIKKMEEAVLWRNPHLKKIWQESEFLWEEPLVINEISFSPKTRIENGVFQVGDSAGMIAPLCGNGMSMALHGAKLLSEFILDTKSLDSNRIFSDYERVWKREFSTRLLVGRIIQGMFGSESMTNAMIRVLSLSPAATRGIIRLTHGTSF